LKIDLNVKFVIISYCLTLVVVGLSGITTGHDYGKSKEQEVKTRLKHYDV